ncbi:MAG: hypothetical protein JW864_05190 [Spirochaetes bacterium]|nr:hypothetical protein [Spirochaetota bacterium]
MDIEKIPYQIWHNLISNKISDDFEFLALKILLTRLTILAKQNSSPQEERKYADEIKNFFIKTQKIPASQRDLQKILKQGGIL